jgi:hypothetical protein
VVACRESNTLKWFKCLIAGENFPGELIGEKNLIGFYTTRFVQSEHPSEVENIVLGNLKNESSLKLPQGVKPNSKAKIYFEEISEVHEVEVPKVKSGFTFYVMGS